MWCDGVEFFVFYFDVVVVFEEFDVIDVELLEEGIDWDDVVDFVFFCEDVVDFFVGVGVVVVDGVFGLYFFVEIEEGWSG